MADGRPGADPEANRRLGWGLFWMFWVGWVAGLITLAVVGYVVFVSGAIDMAASQQPGPLDRMGDSAYMSWLEDSAPRRKNPYADDPEAVAGAASHFGANCVACHGGPGVNRGAFAPHMLPEPPDLGKPGTQKMPAGQLFWVIGHGVRMTGMPAFGQVLGEADLWKLAAFIHNIHNLPPQARENLKSHAPELGGSGGGGGEGGGGGAGGDGDGDGDGKASHLDDRDDGGRRALGWMVLDAGRPDGPGPAEGGGTAGRPDPPGGGMDPVSPVADPTVGFFYERLVPYGNWVWSARCGWVWYPYDVPIDWRPYTYGRWAYTDRGWTWASDWPWGWACFHYGRWDYDAGYGWVWCPGSVWAPAWVAWRYGDGYIGWAPLPPGSTWIPGAGFAPGLDFSVLIPSERYVFVRRDDFHRHRIGRYLASRGRDAFLYERSRTRVTLRRTDGRILNPLPDGERHEMESRLGRPLRPTPLGEAGRPGNAELRDGELRVFRPNPRRGGPPHGTEERPPHAGMPPGLQRRQEAERRALERRNSEERRRLEEEHRAELGGMREPQAVERRRGEQRDELRAQEGHARRQEQLLHNWHEQERHIYSRPEPGEQPPRHFTIPESRPEAGRPGPAEPPRAGRPGGGQPRAEPREGGGRQR